MTALVVSVLENLPINALADSECKMRVLPIKKASPYVAAT